MRAWSCLHRTVRRFPFRFTTRRCWRPACGTPGQSPLQAAELGSTFAVIPAGEAWPTGELRPCLEDWIGAGAVVSHLPGTRSPEAELAVACFERFRSDLGTALRQASSGKELIERGFVQDVDVAAEFDVSDTIPQLTGRCFIRR